MIRPPITITPERLAKLRDAAAGLLAVDDDERAFPPADPIVAELLDAELLELEVPRSPLLLDRWRPTSAGVDIIEWHERPESAAGAA